MPEVKMKKVVALRTGLKNGSIVLEGEEIEVPEGSKAKWYRDVKPSGNQKPSLNGVGEAKLDKAEILKWFDENGLSVDASLGIVKLRESYQLALDEIKSKNDSTSNQDGESQSGE